MNELLTDFEDMLTKEYQDKTRTNLNQIMSKNPRSLREYAESMDIAVNSLIKFLKGNVMSYVVIMKIDNFIKG